MLPFIFSKTFQSLFLFCFLSIIHSQSNAQISPVYLCSDAGNYTASSTYQTNLELLRVELTSNASPTTINFAAQGDIVEPVRGLALCRADITPEDCKSCVETTARETIQTCLYRKVGYGWSEYCFVRYTNRTFVSLVETSPSILVRNTTSNNTWEPNQLNRTLSALISDLIDNATALFGDNFATGEISLAGNQTVYGLVQCTGDISDTNCRTCLQNAFSNYSSELSETQGGRILVPSCNLRFEMYRFYNTTETEAPVPTPPSPSAAPASQLPRLSFLFLLAILAIFSLQGKK